ncbi:glycosyltransferase family 4 protein [Candidatus Peregrinibacteria bacterium]|nr:glycosyltransferase family 4 protein [Candidatus Peregrinibacteria bacterium]
MDVKTKMTLRIGLNARYAQRGRTGIENYVINLVDNLGVIDKENQYLLFQCNYKPQANIPVRENVQSFISRFPTGPLLLRLFWEHVVLFFEIRKKQVDVFHGPSMVLPLFKPRSCKYVVTILDISNTKYPEAYTFFTRLYLHLFVYLAQKKADKIIVISESTKKDLIEYYKVNPQKIDVTYLAASSEFKPISDREKLEEVKAKYNLPDKFILFIGLLNPRKNVRRLILAFQKIMDKAPSYHVVIVGKKGWLFDEIFKEVNDQKLEKRVIFTGYVQQEDLPVFYNLASVFAFPSLYEGFGIPILEAMSCGCPVLTSNVSSMPEVAGNAGLLVNPTSVEEIAAGILKLLLDDALRKDFIQKGFVQVRRFSWKKCAHDTLDVYRSVVMK